MLAITRALPALLLLCLTLVSAQTASTVQGDWVFPGLPDGTVTLVNGNTYTLSWTNHLYAWFPQYAKTSNVANVDLYFVPSTNPAVAGYTVATGISVNTTLSVSYTVNVPDSVVNLYTNWSFKFVPSGRGSQAVDSVASPQLVLNPNPASLSTSTSSSSTRTTTTSSSSSSAARSSSTTPTTTTSARAASTTTGTATTTTGSAVSSSGSPTGSSATSSQTAVPINNGLSTGAKAGIAIGAVGAAALVGILAFFLIRSNRRNKEHIPISQSSPPPLNPAYPVEPKGSYNMQPMGGYYKDNPASPPTFGTQEMSGTTPHYAELEGGQHPRPNIAEMGADGYRR